MKETPEQLFQRSTPQTAFKAVQTGRPVAVGVGDCVYMVASAFGFKTCGRCNRRRAWLNRHTPRWFARVLAWATQIPMPWKKSLTRPNRADRLK